MEKEDLKALDKVKTPDSVHERVATLIASNNKPKQPLWVTGLGLAACFIIGLTLGLQFSEPLPSTITVPNFIYRGEQPSAESRVIQLQALSDNELKELIIELVMLEEYEKADKVMAVLNDRKTNSFN